MNDALPSLAFRPGAMARYFRNPPAVIGAIVLAVIAGASMVSLPWSLPRSPRTDLVSARLPPGPGGGMGTDLLGRSLAARTLLGGAISLSVASAAAMISVVVGVAWGLTAGWLGGRADRIM